MASHVGVELGIAFAKGLAESRYTELPLSACFRELPGGSVRIALVGIVALAHPLARKTGETSPAVAILKGGTVLIGLELGSILSADDHVSLQTGLQSGNTIRAFPLDTGSLTAVEVLGLRAIVIANLDRVPIAGLLARSTKRSKA
jgi:hypothetical protein